MKHEDIKPSLRRRYEFIEFLLMWEGAVGRKLLTQKFEISPQQATLDLTAYLDLAPKNMAYDTRRRTYVTRTNFKPIFSKGEAATYLHQLEMLHHGYRDEDEIWPASIPDFDAVSVASRRVEPKILRVVLQAMRDQQCISATYVSLSSESGSARMLLPHAIASDGHRWHIRAYDLDNQRYSDFVLSRIEKIQTVDREPPELPPDERWSSYVSLCFRPDPDLSDRQRQRLELEYGMEDGKLTIEVRKAMLFYYLRSYGFDPHEIKDGLMRNKSSFSLNVLNLEEVEECIGRRT